MNIEQASKIRNALCVAKGHAQLVKLRCSRLEFDGFDGDLVAIDEAVNRVMAVVVELEREAGIGAINITVGQ